ncbi:DNA kinase/phosphatase Pnk1 [Vanrija albida]|uniref:DNA kinase/phosphatase Pnk1 n=1 Tax=Vanrija albida TaxID=181172 RepID=A0ABR3QD83_9TREE
MKEVKRSSSGSAPPAKKVHSFFTQPAGGSGAGPSRGTFDTNASPSLVHYHYLDPLEGAPPATPVELVLYDLDGTLIKPSSGAKFPKDRNDWMWWNPLVPKHIKDEIKSGKHVIVLSNQGHKAPKIRNEWRAKLPLISAKLGDLPFRVLGALEKDIYRKPHTGMFDFVAKLYKDKGWNIDMDKVVYVGDAAGRKRDHNNTDLTMALNAGIKFYTPEEHFLGETKAYPHPPDSFRPSDSPALQDNLPPVVPSNTPIARDKKEIVVFTGIPASGKTSFYRRHFASYEHINQDTLRTRDACVRAARKKLEEGKSVVIDNTNRNKATRAVYVALAKEQGVPIRLFHFTTPPELAKHNNVYRALHAPADEPKRELLPALAFGSYTADFEVPKLGEGFEEIRTVNFVWEGDEEQRKLWDRYLQ